MYPFFCQLLYLTLFLLTVFNQNSVSLAEAMHVAYRPQLISKKHNLFNDRLKDTNVKIVMQYVKTNK